MSDQIKHIRTGDEVIVISGKDRGKVGEVIKVLPEQERVIVEDMNMAVRHKREQRQGGPSGRIKQEAPIHVSNVMIVDPETGERTRVGREYDDNQEEWVRVTKKSGTRLD